MCNKCFRTNPPDYSRTAYQDWQQHLSQLVDKACDHTADKDWLSKIWNLRNERWSSALGETLRAQISIPAATGDDLVKLYRSAWDYALSGFPEELDAQALEAQSVALANGRQRLGRWLSAYLVKSAAITPDAASAAVSQLQDKVRSANGAYIVLSAHPLDILLTSDFTDGWESCHKWADGNFGCHAAGNFAYAVSSNVLVAFAFSENARINGTTFPRKKWRQLIFVDNCKSAAWFGRQYPRSLPEVQHAPLRRLTAEVLTGDTDPPWRYIDVESRKLFPETNDSHPYLDGSDYAYGVLVTGTDRAEWNSDTCTMNCRIATTICPACNTAHDGDSEKITCADCGGCLTRHCDGCGNDVSISSEDDYDDWANDDSGCYCPDCASDMCYCEHCSQYTTESTYEVRRRPTDRYTINVCADCARALGYVECERCNEMTSADDIRDCDGSSYCHGCAENQGFAPCGDCGEMSQSLDDDCHCENCHVAVVS